jgi:ADP-heptose:LPS heptosyltransferase
LCDDRRFWRNLNPLKVAGFQVTLRGWFTPSPDNYELGEFVKGGSDLVANMCGKTSLRETFALIWAAQGVVCNGSMVLHAAAAFDKPTVVLLGKTFASAQKHKQLWGYGANDLHLGRETVHDPITAPDEVWPILKAHLGLG